MPPSFVSMHDTSDLTGEIKKRGLFRVVNIEEGEREVNNKDV